MDEHVKQIADAVSVTGIIATLAGYLPAIAALFSLIWSVIRIYETKTVQSWLKRKKE